jgi:hypothetical protein
LGDQQAVERIVMVVGQIRNRESVMVLYRQFRDAVSDQARRDETGRRFRKGKFVEAIFDRNFPATCSR